MQCEYIKCEAKAVLRKEVEFIVSMEQRKIQLTVSVCEPHSELIDNGYPISVQFYRPDA